jgi:transcriptional regulator with XRE-family HTH domain
VLFSVDEQIGRRVRRRRLNLGLTQAQLGARAGVRFQQIQKYECVANKISAEMLWRLSVAMDVPPSYFFEAVEECADIKLGPDGEVRKYGPSATDLDTLTKLVGRLKPRVQKHLLALAHSFGKQGADHGDRAVTTNGFSAAI